MNKITHIISSSGSPIEEEIKCLHDLIEQFYMILADFRTSKEGYDSSLKSVKHYVEYLEQLKFNMTGVISSSSNSLN